MGAKYHDCANSANFCRASEKQMMRFDSLNSDACKPESRDCVSDIIQATQNVTIAKQTQKQANGSAILNQRRSSLNKLKASSLGKQYGNRSQQRYAGLINGHFIGHNDEQLHFNSLKTQQQHRLAYQLASSLTQESRLTNNYISSSQINMPKITYSNYPTSASCYNLDADEEIEPIMLIHDDDADDIDRLLFNRVQQSEKSARTPTVFLRGCSSLSMAKANLGSTISPLAKASTSASIASNIISPSASASSLGSSEASSEGEAEEDDDFMTINFRPHNQGDNESDQQQQQQYIAMDEQQQSLNSCRLCGCNWLQDHISLDCRECGGYALTRPCPKCDGSCEQLWTRNISATHDRHTAFWSGNCAFENRNNSKDL